jgi:hypothetical protein
MNRFLVLVLLTAVTALGTEIKAPAPSDQTATSATFNKDVLPVLQNNCQVCHRPGGVAPMSFMTYESTRPWAKAIKAAVVSQKMPPWFADPHVGEFRNAPKLTQADIVKLTAWADSGAQEGNAKDLPAAKQFVDGWRIQPDVIVSMPAAFPIAARGAGEVRQFLVANPFKEDTWVSAIEIRPGDPSVVHHVIVSIPEQQDQRQVFSQAFVGKIDDFNVTVCGNCKEVPAQTAQQQGAEAQRLVRLEAAQAQLAVQQAEVAAKQAIQQAALGVRVNGQRGGGGGQYSDILARLREQQTGEGNFTTMEAVYAPGSQPLDFRYSDSAKLVKAGKPIRIEVHYTPNGKVTTDQTQVAFTLAKAPAQRRFIMMAPEHLVDSRKPIPAGDSNYETTGQLTFKQDADLVWFMPHMHLRGKDMTFRLIYPDGREETVLSAKFNFNWQLGYEVAKPIHLPKGTRMVVTAHHDNSANNPMNPTPGQAVPWGEMTSQEMMLPWFGVVVDREATPEMIATYRPPDLDGLGIGGPAGAKAIRLVAPPDGQVFK